MAAKLRVSGVLFLACILVFLLIPIYPNREICETLFILSEGLMRDFPNQIMKIARSIQLELRTMTGNLLGIQKQVEAISEQ